MKTFEANGITLEQIRDHVWRLPKTDGMEVEGRVLANEALLEEIAGDKTLSQLQNAAHLPGMIEPVLAMPDAHQGYGFPVGGVGAIDAEDGCISPGAVGYDINCLPAGTSIQLSFGRHIDIETLQDCFEDERATVVGEQLTEADIRLFTESPAKPVYTVTTAGGTEIEATADHPFLTPDGMVELADLDPGDTVYIHPFRGLEHESPPDIPVVTAADFGAEHEQLRRDLAERDLLPLSTSDEAFNHLLKVLGYVVGSGTVDEDGRVCITGAAADLATVKADLETIGFEAVTIHSRAAGSEEADSVCTVNLEALEILLAKLGVATGEERPRDFEFPWDFDELTEWQQALFYSAYFGAKLDPPTGGEDGRLVRPTITETRSPETAEAGLRFLEEIKQFLQAVGIETTDIQRAQRDTAPSTESVHLQLGIENDRENLIRFFSRVGYRYNDTKQRRAIKALQYLKERRELDPTGEDSTVPRRPLADGGTPPESGPLEAQEPSYPAFDTFCRQRTIQDNLTVETELQTIEPAGRKPVYDIGVDHDAHNFIANEFVVSNCGVRMLRTNLTIDELRGNEEELVETLFANIPTGLGGGGIVETDVGTVDDILENGVEWAIEAGYGVEADLLACEDEGRRPDADPAAISQEAKQRGKTQLGSLGSGNHFLEVQRVTDIFREEVAAEFGLREDQIVVLIHCGSRGLGHQTCNDYLRKIEQTHSGLLDSLPDKELAAAPAGSQLAEEYYGAMCAAINFAWVNRQLIMHRTRRVFERVFDRSWEAMEMELLYDVAHNIAKKETHTVDGADREVYVHRKGATRAFPAGHPEVPAAYRDVGQPIIIPGSMGAGSYVLRGGENALAETFGSTAHGAGRLMSRTQAKNEYWGGDVQDELREREDVYVKAQSGATIAEEAPGVYKDVDAVVAVSDALGIGDQVARTFPVVNIKG